MNLIPARSRESAGMVYGGDDCRFHDTQEEEVCGISVLTVRQVIVDTHSSSNDSNLLLYDRKDRTYDGAVALFRFIVKCWPR